MESARSVKIWVELPTKIASQRQRRAVVRNWVSGNHLLENVPDTHLLSEAEKERVWRGVYEACERGISAVRSGTLDVYQSINAMIDSMQRRGASPSTIFGHRFKLVKLFRYLKLEIDEDDLKQAVRPVDSSRVTDDKQPTREQVRDMLVHGSPKQKALISFLVCTGARVGEAVQVKLSDIEFDKRPVIVRFPARKTKTARKRYAFLSSECLQFIKTHIANRDRVRTSEWLFEGWIPTQKRDAQKDKHVSTASAYLLVRGMFELVGLIPPEARSNKTKNGPDFGPHQPYHTHVLRGTNLSIAKSTGFPDSYAEFLAGRSTGSKEHYFNEDEIARFWLEKCEPAFCFLTAKTEQPKQSYFEETIDSLANSKGMDHEEVKNAIIAILARGGDFKKIEAEMRAEAIRIRDATRLNLRPDTSYFIQFKPIKVPAEAVAARMTPDQVRPAVISWVKSLEAAPTDAPDRVVDVDDGELDRFTKLGWRFVSIVNAKKAVVRWERKSDPVYPMTPDSILDEDSKTGVASQQ